jgi:hypothetical protein
LGLRPADAVTTNIVFDAGVNFGFHHVPIDRRLFKLIHDTQSDASSAVWDTSFFNRKRDKWSFESHECPTNGVRHANVAATERTVDRRKSRYRRWRGSSWSRFGPCWGMGIVEKAEETLVGW